MVPNLPNIGTVGASISALFVYLWSPICPWGAFLSSSVDMRSPVFGSAWRVSIAILRRFCWPIDISNVLISALVRSIKSLAVAVSSRRSTDVVFRDIPISRDHSSKLKVSSSLCPYGPGGAESSASSMTKPDTDLKYP